MAKSTKPSAASIRKAEESFKAKSPAQLAQLDATSKAVAEKVVTTTTPPVTVLDDRIDWVAETERKFLELGMKDFGPVLTRLVQQGYKGTSLTSKLEETPEYKTRFAANTARVKKGLPPLNPATYLAMEAGYKNLMRQAGLPQGFYDTQDDFQKFLENDVSTVELKSRIDAAQLSLDNADPFYTQSLENYYGLGPGDMLAYALDPERSMPFISKRVQAAQIGAAAARQGLNVGMATAESLGTLGVTQQQAEQGFQTVAQIAPIAQKLSNIYKNESAYGQEEAMAEAFGGTGAAKAAEKRRRLIESERSSFAGQAGVGTPSLGRTTQGQF